ncbi:MAG: urea amidolyase associated protein UAAP1 [Ilumatobacteraceae bacterium]
MPGPRTSSLQGARDHARAQAGAVAETGRAIPASSGVGGALPVGLDPATVIWDETVGPGGYAGRVLPRDAVLRIVDTGGDACVHLVVHNAHHPAERINVADTVKVQWQAYLGPTALLLSDMGRVLMTFVTDTSGRHDALCGTSTPAATAARFGDSGIHSATPSGRDLLVVAAAKQGLAARDLPAGVNLFKRVVVAEDGSLTLDGEPRPSTAVELRAELDVLVLLANVPHPLDRRPTYTSSVVRCTAWIAGRPANDPLRSTSPERQRAFENTDDHLAGAR